MWAARVLRHVAADCAGLLAARVRCIEESQVRDRFRKLDIRHSRFDHRDPVRRVDLEDSAHPCGGDDHPSPVRHGTAAQPRPRSTRRHRQPPLVAEAHDLRHLVCTVRKDHGVGTLSLHRAIEFVNDQVFGAPEDVAFADDLRQRRNQFTTRGHRRPPPSGTHGRARISRNG